MARWAPERKDTLGALADEILHNYARGRVIIAVDGNDGAGTSDFADDLAEALRTKSHTAFRASVDGFQRPRADRYARGHGSAEGYYRDSFNYSVLRRVLVEPFRMGGSTAFVTAAFDTGRDAEIEPKWTTGPDDAILIIDGVFLNRPELRGLWNYSIWLDVPRDLAGRHAQPQAGSDDAGERLSGGQNLYWAEARPRTAAVAIIDNTDVEHPRRVFADSC